jgi:hypothetical protein
MESGENVYENLCKPIGLDDSDDPLLLISRLFELV